MCALQAFLHLVSKVVRKSNVFFCRIPASQLAPSVPLGLRRCVAFEASSVPATRTARGGAPALEAGESTGRLSFAVLATRQSRFREAAPSPQNHQNTLERPQRTPPTGNIHRPLQLPHRRLTPPRFTSDSAGWQRTAR